MVSFPRHRRGLVLLLASACPAVYSFQNVVVPPPTLPSSEDLHYSIEWRLISAGKAHLSWGGTGASGFQTNLHLESAGLVRSEERRVGKEWRCRWWGWRCQ